MSKPSKKILVFMGTRPEAIKMAPVIRAIEALDGLEPIVVSTGQHREMLQQVVEIFEIPVHHDLAVMQPNQTLASLTARLISSIDVLLDQVKPDFALVQGDTTTVLSAALACFYRRIPLGHVEAGLRTGDISTPFPEEANRRLASPLVTLHFAPTQTSQQNLLREGVCPDLLAVTGNTVIDALHLEVSKQQTLALREKIDHELAGLIGADWHQVPFVLITGHRRENFGQGFQGICQALAALSQKFPAMRFVYPVHLNPNVQKPVYDCLGHFENIKLIPPQGYRNFVALMHKSKLVLTDSGGVQEEAPGLGKPVLVMRESTERPEGVEAGTVRLVGTDPTTIVHEVSELLTNQQAYQAMSHAVNPYGDGQSGIRIAKLIKDYLNKTITPTT